MTVLERLGQFWTVALFMSLMILSILAVFSYSGAYVANVGAVSYNCVESCLNMPDVWFYVEDSRFCMYEYYVPFFQCKLTHCEGVCGVCVDPSEAWQGYVR